MENGLGQDAGRFMARYFDALGADADLSPFLTDDVTWTDMDTGRRWTGAREVQAHITALHTELYDAHPEGAALEVTDTRAVLEGAFVGDTVARRVPFCLVYDLAAAGISAMRLYTASADLEPLRRTTVG